MPKSSAGEANDAQSRPHDERSSTHERSALRWELRLTARPVLEAMATYPDRRALFVEYPELEEEDLRQVLALLRLALNCYRRRGSPGLLRSAVIATLDSGFHAWRQHLINSPDVAEYNS